jgi:hypothetical protein
MEATNQSGLFGLLPQVIDLKEQQSKKRKAVFVLSLWPQAVQARQ